MDKLPKFMVQKTDEHKECDSNTQKIKKKLFNSLSRSYIN